MKKITRMILSMLLLVGGTGCSDLIELEPENSVTFVNYFKTEKDLQSLLYNVHFNLRGLPMLFADVTERVSITNGSYQEDELPLLLFYWTPEYKIIAAADLIIDNVHRCPLSDAVKKPYLLQCYFAKAVAYFQLATDFGEAPIVEDAANFGKYGQSSVSAVLDEAEKWALLANDLPNYEDLKLGDIDICKQYASQGALQALLAKLYAWRAGVEGKAEYWAKAEECCRKIIDNEVGAYKLAANPEEVCIQVMKGESPEGIWELYRSAEEIDYGYFYGKVGFLGGWGGMVSFPVVFNSTPTETKNYVVTKKTVNDLFDDADLRKEAYFWRTNADSIFIKKLPNGNMVADTAWKEGDVVSKRYDNQIIEKAYLYKYRHAKYSSEDWTSNPTFKGLQMSIIKCRLSDVYLLRAECRARQNKPNAVDDLNFIRLRAYGNSDHDYPNADDAAKGLDGDIQLAIFREREKELFLEGHRFYDARRNGVDYVRRYCTHYSKFTDQDVEDGGFYLGLGLGAFNNNDLLRQNTYWNRRLQ